VFQQGEYDRDVVLDHLGDELWSSRISAKPFPGGRGAHALVEAALVLRAEAPDDPIDQAVLHLPAGLAGFRAAEWPSGRQATYSLPFAVALVLATGRAPVEAFVRPETTPSGVRSLFDRISIVDDASGSEHGVVEVVHRSGRASRLAAERASGHPGNALSEEARLAKLWSCSDHAGEPLPRGALEKVVDLTARFEQIASTSELTALLSAHCRHLGRDG
jgi:2-methylcitrate dehydratase PrpD